MEAAAQRLQQPAARDVAGPGSMAAQAWLSADTAAVLLALQRLALHTCVSLPS